MFQRLTAFAVLPLLLVAGEIGTVQNNVYHHNRTGIEFTLPSGWSVGSQKPSADGAQMVYVKDSVTEAMGAAWFKLQSVDAENIPAFLDRRLDAKVAQRNNFQSYRFRPDSVQRTTIGGHPAIGAVADYVSAGQLKVEYITWIDAPNCRVLFSVQMPVGQFPAFQPLFDELIRSVVFPN